MRPGYEEQAPDWRHLLVEHWRHSGQEDSPLRFEITLINEEKTSGSMVINIFNFDYHAVKGCHFALNSAQGFHSNSSLTGSSGHTSCSLPVIRSGSSAWNSGPIFMHLGCECDKFNEIICLRKA